MLVGAWQFGVQGYLVQRRRGGEGTVARASQEEGGERRPTDLRVEGWRIGKKWRVAVRWAVWSLRPRQKMSSDGWSSRDALE